MILIYLALAAAAQSNTPIDEDRSSLKHCFARASLEHPWADRSSDDLITDAVFARHLVKRCNPEDAPLRAQAFDMVRAQRGPKAAPIDPIEEDRQVDANMVILVARILPEALKVRTTLPKMTLKEQATEFQRWLLDGDLSDNTSQTARLHKTAKCAVPLLMSKEAAQGDACGIAMLLRDLVAAFGAQFPDANPEVTEELARQMLPMAMVFAAIETGPATDDRKLQEKDAPN